MLKFNYVALREALTGAFDVVVGADVHYCLAAICAKMLLGKKFVYDSHEIVWDCGLGPLPSKALKILEGMVLRYCDLWLVPSEDRAEVVLKAHKICRPYSVLENFPIINQLSEGDKARAKPTRQLLEIPSQEIVVMYQGTLMPDRGIEQLVGVACIGKVHVVIQGAEIEGGQSIRQYLNQHVNEGVTVLNACPNTEVLQWLSIADFAFVYYKNDCLNSAYACSNKFYNAVFAGVPIICNRLPAFESFSRRFGGIVFLDNLSSSEIHRCLECIMDDPRHYQKLKQEISMAREHLFSISREETILSAFSTLW
jgi:glycosyltransferase involved in cell wall biosynthesis